MIKSITLRNFQIHKDLTIDLSESVTITGATDSGKTAILRALDWVFYNTPLGKKYNTYGEDECVVTIVVDDHTIQRIRSKKENKYVVDGVELTAFGNKVPKQVTDILNLSTTSTKRQDDPRFLVNDTPSEIGKKLNEIVNLTIVDSTIRNIKLDVKRHRDQVRTLNKQNKEYTERIKGLSYLAAYEEHLVELERIEAEVTEKTEYARELQTQITLNNAFLAILRASNDLRVLQDTLEQIEAIEEQKQRIVNALTVLTTKTIPYNDMHEFYFELTHIKEASDALEVRHRLLGSITYVINQKAEEISRIEKTISQLNKEIETAYSSVCPTCGQIIKEIA